MRKRVLLVEDEGNIAESLSFLLGRAGFDLMHSPTGEDALAQAKTISPDVVVLDLMLPTISGFDILKQLRGDLETQRIPVLMLTAKGQADDRRVAKELGVDAYMTKPFSNTEVVETVMQLSAQRAEG